MAKTLKTKSRAAPAAQSREEAEQLVARVGEIQRELTRRDADLGDQVAAVKATAEREAEPLKVELIEAQAMIQGWCEANRGELTHGGKTKTAAFATGEVKWRLRPPSVTVRGVEAVIAWCKDRLDGRFVRTKEEIDKEAILADPEIGATIPGVKIGSAGEDFVIEPFTAELAAVA